MKEDKRTVGVVLLVSSLIAGEAHILIEERSDNIPHGGLWCLPCGHLELNETGEEASVRETFEETGILYGSDKIKLLEVDTSPTIHNQNVILRYYTKAKGTIIQTFNKDEVKQIKWIKLEEVDNFNWAFNHGEVIKRMLFKLKNAH